MIRLPLNSVHRAMKSESDEIKVSEDAKILMTLACQMFIDDVTNHAYDNAKEYRIGTNRRKKDGDNFNLTKQDFINALSGNQNFDFLIDTFPKKELNTSGAPPSNN